MAEQSTDLLLPELCHEAHHHSPQVGGAGEHLQHVQHLGHAELEQTHHAPGESQNGENGGETLLVVTVRFGVYVYCCLFAMENFN